MKNNSAVSMWGRSCALVLCLLLSACASQPNGSHSFAVVPSDEEPGVWKLEHLAGSGRVDLTMRLHGDSDRAAAVSLKFNYRSRFDLGTTLDFEDRACRGAYNLSLTHQHDRDRLTDYLGTRLPWEETARLRVEWRSDGRLAVTVNGREQKIVDIDAPVKTILVEARYGEIVVDDLTYTQLTAATPFLPPENNQ